MVQYIGNSLLLSQIRDPPQEGMFLYGVHLWGSHFEKTVNLDLHDSPPKSITPSSLPVVHLTVRMCPPPVVSQGSETKPPYTYYCPCYQTRGSCDELPLFHLRINSSDVQATKWSLRNLSCTLRPF